MKEEEYQVTIVSIVPWDIAERKVGIYPGYFIIPAYEEPLSTPINKMRPQVLHIGESKHFVYIGEDRPDIAVPTSPAAMASAIVRDYLDSMIEVKDGMAPGLFFLTEKIESKDIAAKYPNELKFYKDKQMNWFRALLTLADDDWNKYHKHTVISDLQRKVAQLMGLKKDWLSIVEAEPPIMCPVCSSLISPKAIVCPHCHLVLQPEIYKTYQFSKEI